MMKKKSTAPNAIGRYEPVIGLEVHAQLLTRSKAFCGCSTEFGKDPNHAVCPVCLGMPGVLPVLNYNLVDYILRMGLATHCTVSSRSVFARKNYFYPDLPKGYQISQYEEPVCTNGYVEIDLENGARKRIGIARIHMEEDAGKSIHDLDPDTLIDINRCGIPLIEIVSEPAIGSAREAYLYLLKIKQIVTYLGICDGNMEEGSLRCDANISVRLKGDKQFGTKTEVKNLNSFRNVERALEYEIRRQIELLEEGEEVVQATLLWDADENIVVPMRSKEEAHDYRYFPEPDLLTVEIGEPWVKRVKNELPELPTERFDRFISEYQLPRYDAEILTISRDLADYFERAVKNLHKKEKGNIKTVSNWVMGDVLKIGKERNLHYDSFPIPAEHIGELVDMITEGTISGKIAKEVFELMLTDGKHPRKIVEEKGLVQLSDSKAIESVIDNVLRKFPDQVKEYKGGKTKVLGFFVGNVMKETEGKANPGIVNDLIKKKLDAVE